MPLRDALIAAAEMSTSITQEYGPVIGGTVALSAGAWAVVKFLFARIEQSHAAHLQHANEAIQQERQRAERAEARADRYEQELKESVKIWFEQVSPTMSAAARAIDAVTSQLRMAHDERRH